MKEKNSKKKNTVHKSGNNIKHKGKGFQTEPSPTTVKLTKQQKRDLKRNQKQKEEQKKGNETSVTKVMYKQHEREVIQLQKSVYKRKNVYPTTNSLPTAKVKGRFVQPSDGDIYKNLMNSSYLGFNEKPPNYFPDSFHQKVLVSLL